MRFLALLGLFITGCSNLVTPLVNPEPLPSNLLDGQSTQLIVVISEDWNATQGQLYSFEMQHQRWLVQPMGGAVTLGKKGLAWGLGLHPAQPGLQKAEGDGRAPAGMFTLSAAFGYADIVETLLPYQAMQSDDFCIDVPTSPLYNQTVNRSKFQPAWVANSTEPMRRDLHLKGDQAYQLGVFIDHNPTNVAGAGSCIFMHVWQSPTTATAGCTAMSKAQLQQLVRWLDPAKQPRYVVMPRKEYQWLQQAWQLPEIPASL